jgi:peroxiredoxin
VVAQEGAVVRWLAAIALAVILALGCGGRAAPAAPRMPIALVLRAADGGEIDVLDYRGKVVVLHVFTTWSLAATGDVPQLIAAHDRPGKEVVVIGIATDLEGYSVVSPWRSALDVRYLIAIADEALRAGDTALGALPVVPTTLVLDRNGAIAKRIERQLAPGELATAIDEVLEAR